MALINAAITYVRRYFYAEQHGQPKPADPLAEVEWALTRMSAGGW